MGILRYVQISNLRIECWELSNQNSANLCVSTCLVVCVCVCVCVCTELPIIMCSEKVMFAFFKFFFGGHASQHVGS